MSADQRWSALVLAMQMEGYDFDIRRYEVANERFAQTMNHAWKRSGPDACGIDAAYTADGWVDSPLNHPIEALADLLAKCRARWPTPPA